MSLPTPSGPQAAILLSDLKADRKKSGRQPAIHRVEPGMDQEVVEPEKERLETVEDLDKLFHCHHASMKKRLISRLGFSAADAQDIIQDTYLLCRELVSAPGFAPPQEESPLKFVMRKMINWARNQPRYIQHHSPKALHLGHAPLDDQPESSTENPDGRAHLKDPETARHDWEMEVVFEQVLQAVESQVSQDKNKSRIFPFWSQGMGDTEIAKNLGLSRERVGHHTRGLKELFKREWDKRLPAVVVLLCVVCAIALWNKPINSPDYVPPDTEFAGIPGRIEEIPLGEVQLGQETPIQLSLQYRFKQSVIPEVSFCIGNEERRACFPEMNSSGPNGK